MNNHQNNAWDLWKKIELTEDHSTRLEITNEVNRLLVEEEQHRLAAPPVKPV